MELTNKRITYSVKNEDSNFKLEGEVSINENNVITFFSGTFQTLESNYAGNFNYSEDGNGLINKSVNSIPQDGEDNAISLLDKTIDEIKIQVKE